MESTCTSPPRNMKQRTATLVHCTVTALVLSRALISCGWILHYKNACPTLPKVTQPNFPSWYQGCVTNMSVYLHLSNITVECWHFVNIIITSPCVGKPCSALAGLWSLHNNFKWVLAIYCDVTWGNTIYMYTTTSYTKYGGCILLVMYSWCVHVRVCHYCYLTLHLPSLQHDQFLSSDEYSHRQMHQHQQLP